MKPDKITSLCEYISKIETIYSYYPSSIMSPPANNPFIYRGLSDRKYKLIPGIYRSDTIVDAGLRIENSTYLSWTSEKSLLRHFQTEARGILDIPTDDLVRWAEYAQHYGVPTRFLDWSSNPLVALFFACQNEKRDGSVWMLHRVNYEKYREKEDKSIVKNGSYYEVFRSAFEEKPSFDFPIVYTPYYVDSRMSSQSSFFMVWGKNANALEDILNDKKFNMFTPKIDDGSRTYGHQTQDGMTYRYIICRDDKKCLLRELDRVGINDKSLFPGLDGIGRYIEKKYHFDYKEALDAF